jgi:hypothetical protein
MTVVDTLVLLTLFQLKHFLADYPLQTIEMVREKGIYGRQGGIYHSLIHAVLTFGMLGLVDFTVFPVEYTFAFGIAALEFVIHYHIDWSKMQMSKRFSTEDKGFWNWIGFDQLLHHLTYAGFVWILIP